MATKRTFTPRQLAAQARFAAMAKNKARARPQGGVSRHNNPPPLAAPAIIQARTALHVVLTTATATAPGAAGAAASAVTGDSLTTRNYRDPSIVALWSTNQSGGFHQLAFPTGHDTTRGYRVNAVGGGTEIGLPVGMQIPLTPQEVIAATIAGSATAGDVEQMSFLTAYRDDQGQRWESFDHVRTRMREMTTIDFSLASSAGPGYSGTELINADSDLLQANRDYAVIGFITRTRVHALGIVGPDTGNDRIACPGNIRADLTSRWFPMIFGACPVINSGNRASTNFFCATDENAGTFTGSAILALLA